MITELSDVLLEQSDHIVAVASQPTTDSIFIAFADNSVRIFTPNTAGSMVRAGSKVAQDSLQVGARITSLCLHPFIPNFAVVGLEQGKVVVWDAQNARHVTRDDLMASDVTTCKWLAHGRILAFADAVGRVVLSAYDPITSELRPVQKVQRPGRVVEIVERTACTHNFYLNFAIPDSEMDKIYPQIGTGPLEVLVAWDKGDIVDIQDAQAVVLVCSVAQGVHTLLYVPELDSGCAVSPAGDLVVFGFESTAWRAKRTVLSRTKIEFSLNGGICSIGGGRLAFVSSTMTQVKIYDVIQQQAVAVELDDHIDGACAVTGAIQFAEGLGVVVPLAKQSGFCIVSDVPQSSQALGQRYEPIEQNQHYVSMIDRQLAEGQLAGQSQQTKFTIKEIMKLDQQEASSDIYIQEIRNDGDIRDCEQFILCNRPFNQQGKKAYTILTFKQPVFGTSSLQNQAILQQQMSNEPLNAPNFLEKQFNEACNYNITALQTNTKQIKVYVNTTQNKLEQYSIGVSHTIEKIVISQQLGSSKSAYVLVYGNNNFSVFEVGEGFLPATLESFKLPENDYQVYDCVLFGKYVLAAVGTKLAPNELEYAASQILKLTFAGKVSQTMAINYNQEGRNNGICINKLSICNQHLFMLTSSSNMFYCDLRQFQKFQFIGRLSKDYLFNETSQVRIAGQNDQDGPVINIATTIGSTFNLGTIQVNTMCPMLALDGTNLVNVAVTFKGFNEIVQRNLELPCVTVLQLNMQEIAALPQAGQGGQGHMVSSYRTFDFTPARVKSAALDAMGNLVVEAESSDFYKYLLLQFSSFTTQRFGLWNRVLILYDNSSLLKHLIELEQEFADDNAEQSQEMQTEGLSMVTFLKFLSIRVGQEHRLLISRKDTPLKVRKDLVVVQGLYAPYIVPKTETQELEPSGTLVGVISPAILTAQRLPYGGRAAQTNALSVLSVQNAISTLYTGNQGQGFNPLGQNAHTSYTLTQFVVAVQNNRFNDAYAFVAHSESAEIWRSLASLCIRNGYTDLLRTCVSHIRCPVISLLLRGQSAPPGATDASQGASKQCGLAGQAARDQELSAMLSIALGELPAGLQLVSDKPILHSRIMQRVGLATYSLLDTSQGQTMGFNAITRKSNVYCLASRLYRLGDYQGANACYTELFQSGINVFNNNQDTINQQVANKQNVNAVREEFESNGIHAAVALAKQLNTKPALYTAATLVEGIAAEQGKDSYYNEASRLFFLAGCQQHAMDCALASQNDELIYNIGSTADNPRLSLLAAGHFAKHVYDEHDDEPETSNLEKALVLYSCSGYTGQAVELCLSTNMMKELSGILHEVIRTRREELNIDVQDDMRGEKVQTETSQAKTAQRRRQKQNISQELLVRAGQALISTKQEDWALDDYNSFIKTGILALAHAKATDQALYCISQSIIPITAEIADLLTPEDLSSEENQSTVLTIGKLLFKAELYQQAVKKFISVGNSYLALQSLIKLGDVNKIVKFAQMSRNKDCFKAAANFLQTQNFRDNPQYMNMIIQFYGKAGAIDYLVKFFVNCAREEIDVFNDYEKAMDALREAAKWIGRVIQQKSEGNEAGANAAMIAQLEEQKANIEQNGKLINGFLHLIEYARNNLNSVDAAEAMSSNSKKLLQAVVQQDNCMVRVEHILAFLAEFHAQRGEGQRVITILSNMVQKGIDINKYVQEDVVEQYGPSVGVRPQAQEVVEQPQVVDEVPEDGTGLNIDASAPPEAAAQQQAQNMDDLDIEL